MSIVRAKSKTSSVIPTKKTKRGRAKPPREARCEKHPDSRGKGCKGCHAAYNRWYYRENKAVGVGRPKKPRESVPRNSDTQCDKHVGQDVPITQCDDCRRVYHRWYYKHYRSKGMKRSCVRKDSYGEPAGDVKTIEGLGYTLRRLGVDVLDFAYDARIPEALARRACDGQAIDITTYDKIAAYFSKRVEEERQRRLNAEEQFEKQLDKERRIKAAGLM